MKPDEHLYTLFKAFIEQDNHPYYFYTHDKDGNITYISENITQLLGLSSDEFKADYMSYATASPLNKEMIRYTYRALQGKEQEAYKIEIYDKDFFPHILRIKEKPIFEGNKVVGLQGVAKLLS
jgi:PAS domain S-box-containing protein